MGKIKKFFTILPAVLAVFSIIVVLWYAISTYNLSQGKTDLEYLVDEATNTITITGFSGDETSIKIPETILGNTVVAIEDYAFKDKTNIIAVHIPKTITSIGKGAFYGCENLAFVWDLEKCERLTKIEDEVFYNCKKLKHIKLPNSMISIGVSAFRSCYSLEELHIPNSVTNIGKQAFDNCQSINEFKIPRGVKMIEEKTFHACLSMKSIELPEGITYIADAAFANCYELKSIVIPSSVEIIGKQAFTTCKSLSSITIHEGLREIGEASFVECYALTEITFPASLEYLGAELFRSNNSLKCINVDASNTVYTSIDGVLYSKNLSELIAYPTGKTDNVFSIPEGVVVISKAVFACNKNLATLNIPTTVNTINDFFLYESLVNTINYQGSVLDWNKINKVNGWDLEARFNIINCTDGQIIKDGKVTYK